MVLERDAGIVAYETSLADLIDRYVPLTVGERHDTGDCPFCGEPKGLRVLETQRHVSDRVGSFYCVGCGARSDIYDFLQRYHGVNFHRALRMIGAEPRVETYDLHQRPTREADKMAWVHRFWESAEPLRACSPASDYLASCAIGLTDLPPISSLAETTLQYRNDGQEHPVLLAALHDEAENLVGVQRTYLTKRGALLPVENPVLNMGRVRGTAIKIGEATNEITICEGLESALSLKLMHPAATVWAAPGPNMMQSLPIPNGCTKLVIAEENSPRGSLTANRSSAEFAAPGREIIRLAPSAGCTTFNDELMASAVI